MDAAVNWAGGKAFDAAFGVVAKASKGLRKSVQELREEALKKPEQLHHTVTKGPEAWRNEYEKILQKYGATVEDAWNKRTVNHSGDHPVAYREWILRQLVDADEVAQAAIASGRSGGDVFTDFMSKVSDFVQAHPEMLMKEYWR